MQNSKLFLSLSIIALFVVGGTIWAFSKDNIVFPVAELGNCASEQDCRAYCEQPDNMEVCLDFAERHNLLSDEEIARAKAFLAAGSGPGGCASPQECETYCNDASHLEECIIYARDHNLMSPDELAEAKQVLAALQAGAKLPGGCTRRQECDVYCSEPSHMEECLTFAEAAGFIPPDELAEAKKMLVAIKKGATPPPCRGKEECDAYCMEPEHFEECITFAEAAGLMPPEELAQAKQALVAIKKGVMPPPCRGKDECDAYCQDHMEECINFAEAAGMMSPEEAEMARKTGGKGPGGCMGEEECRAFCDDPANQEECFNFAMEHGLMSEEDLQQMRQGMQQMQEALSQAPPEVRDCLVQKLGLDTVQNIENGTGVVNPQTGDVMKECFEQFMPIPGGMMEPPEGGMMPPGDFDGGKMGMCPAMPTVTDCPTGQRKELVFSSPECGDYYACVPEGRVFPEGEYQPPIEQMPPEGQIEPIEQAPPPGSEEPTGLFRQYLEWALAALITPILNLLR